MKLEPMFTVQLPVRVTTKVRVKRMSFASLSYSITVLSTCTRLVSCRYPNLITLYQPTPGPVHHVIEIAPGTPWALKNRASPEPLRGQGTLCELHTFCISYRSQAPSWVWADTYQFVAEWIGPAEICIRKLCVVESSPLPTLLSNRKLVSTQPYSSGELPMEFREKAMISFLGTFLNWQWLPVSQQLAAPPHATVSLTVWLDGGVSFV
jgi:hypothetical protein